MFRYYRYPCSFRCGSFSLVVVQSFLPRKLPGIRVCMCSGTVAHYVTYGGFFFFNASRFTGVNTYGGAAANHRTASPRRPAPRRSTTTNRPPFRPVRAFRTWPSALFHVFFLCVFFLFFFFTYTFSAFTDADNRSTTEYRYANMCLGSRPRILQSSDDIFVSRPKSASRRRCVA